MEREEIYRQIDKERDYQQRRWDVRQKKDGVRDADKEPETWILYIEHHLSLAKFAAYNLDKQNTMAELRKIAALAVAAMEIHGCPDRLV